MIRFWPQSNLTDCRGERGELTASHSRLRIHRKWVRNFSCQLKKIAVRVRCINELSIWITVNTGSTYHYNRYIWGKNHSSALTKQCRSKGWRRREGSLGSKLESQDFSSSVREGLRKKCQGLPGWSSGAPSNAGAHPKIRKSMNLAHSSCL